VKISDPSFYWLYNCSTINVTTSVIKNYSEGLRNVTSYSKANSVLSTPPGRDVYSYNGEMVQELPQA
jgi:hypothetical protein